ncbi:MAG TPA: toll/interleukin-1 receptor domain-containing protein [Thermoanaerobaculia bacterium]|jgi:hypothetical protein
MADVFLSYASEDRETAARFAAVLAQRGFSVWWDRDIAPGRPFADVLEEELQQAKCVVVLWSNAARTSHWVFGEADEGLRRGVLVPVRLDATVPIPLQFRRIQMADLCRWPERPNELEPCMVAVAAVVAGESKSSADPALRRLVRIAQGYLKPQGMPISEAVAAEILDAAKAFVPLALDDVRPLLHSGSAAERVVAYLATQAALQTGQDVSGWGLALAACLSHERDEASERHETRPMFRLLVVLDAVLHQPNITTGTRDHVLDALDETLQFLRSRSDIDTGHHCMSHIEGLLHKFRR